MLCSQVIGVNTSPNLNSTPKPTKVIRQADNRSIEKPDCYQVQLEINLVQVQKWSFASGKATFPSPCAPNGSRGAGFKLPLPLWEKD